MDKIFVLWLYKNMTGKPFILIIVGVAVVAAVAVYVGLGAGGGSDGTTAGLIDAVGATDHVKGNPAAKVVLIEYSDFQCPACGAYYPLVRKLADDYANDIAFVYRHFPLQQHPNAIPAARAAEAAALQGKFWEMHNTLFEHQEIWAEAANPTDMFMGYARELGLAEEQFRRDYEADAGSDRAKSDFQSGLRAGVNATPTFYLNGKRIESPRSYDAFKAVLDEAIAQNR